MSIVARVQALERQVTAWTAEDAVVSGDAAIIQIADTLGALAVPELPMDQAPTGASARLDWVFDALGAPESLPGGHGPVGVSRADRLAALLGMTSKELARALDGRAS